MSKLTAGEIRTLTANREADFGFFLIDDNPKDRVLLHNNEITGEIQLGDEVEVFLFHDKDGRLSATMSIPHITLDTYADVFDRMNFGAVEKLEDHIKKLENII